MKISVIVATYNSAATLRSTFDSLLRQTYQDYEVVVCDGCSTDGTLAIIDEYRQRFGGRMNCISEPDNGLYEAMNKGISRATGDILGILNSDDFYTSDDILETIAREFEASYLLEAIYGDIHYVHADKLDVPTRYYSSRMFRPWWMRFGFMPAHPSFYCRRELYSIYGKYDTQYKVAADFEQLLRLIYVHKIRTKYIHKDFVTMRTGGASNSGISSHLQITRDHLKALKANGIYSNFFFLSLRYLYKTVEVFVSKVRLHFDSN